MIINYPFKVFSDFFTIIVLITLSVYHLLIYFGRKKIINEKYNLFFSIFSISFALFVLTSSSIYIELAKSIYFYTPTIQTIFIFGFFYGALSFFSVLFNLNRQEQIPFYICYVLILTELILTFSNFIFDNSFYNKYILNPALIMTAAVVIISLFFLTFFIITKKYYKNIYLMIIYTGYCLIMIYLTVNIFIIGFNFSIDRYIKNNWLFVGSTIFMFAYALSIKFNNEFKQLIDLKKNLENKVKIRTDELNKAKEEIEKKSAEKINFFINIAHETKTPLTLISNYLNRYINKKGKDKDITIVKQNIDKLTRDMINFLDSEKLEKGQIFYNHTLISNFSDILDKRVILFKHYAKIKKIKIITKIEKNIYIKADPYAVDRIINNIIENAVKYTGENGKINIELFSDYNTIIFKVEDTGIGIPQSKIDNIFIPFHQISYKKRNIQGIGMGLSIVNKIVTSLNGKINIKSTINEGSEFIIKLNNYILKANDTINNFDIPENLSSIIIPKKIKDTELQKDKNTILIVEDNHDLLSYMFDELSILYNVITAKNGKEALNKLCKISKPDLIISDIMMDEMDGYSFLVNVSDDNRYTHIPFIFITAKTSQQDKLKGLKDGAVDFIFKPFLIDELKLKIKSILDISHKQKMNTLDNAISLLTKEKYNLTNEDKNIEILFLEKCRKNNLTERQIEIVELLKNGFEYKEIADKLNLSDKTINNHMQNIYKKTKTHNKIELINILSN